MTRNKTDTIIGIVGAAAIVFALVGVFVYEYNNVEPSNGGTEVDPPISTETFPGSVGADDSSSVTFTPGQGVMTIQVDIAWTPTAPGALAAAAAYSYEFASPDGTILESGSSSEAASFSVAGMEAGAYTLTISTSNPSQGGDFEATATYDY